MVEARLAMGELERYLDEVEKIAKRTRGEFYLKDSRKYPSLREVL